MNAAGALAARPPGAGLGRVREGEPLFLVHYARADDTIYVRRFFADVQSAVYRRLGRGAASLGRPRPAGLGADPPPGTGETASAVLACGVFVALYTTSYLRDDACFREWALFNERVRWHNRLTGRSTPALIGVRWCLDVGTEERTIVAPSVLHGDFGPEYDAGGALRLARTVGTPSPGWTRLLDDVVSLVAAASDDPPPTMAPRDLDRLSFVISPDVAGDGPDPAAGPSPASRLSRSWYVHRPPRPRGSGDELGRPGPAPARRPGRPPLAGAASVGAPVARGPAAGVRVVVAAPTTRAVPPGRHDRRFYGDTALDWRPFLPQDTRPAVEIVCTELTRVLDPGVDIRGEALVGEPRQFGQSESEFATTVTLLVVDPWAARGPSAAQLREWLSRWQAAGSAVAGPIFVFPGGDGETAAVAEALRDEFRAVMRYQPPRESGDRLFDETRTPDGLALRAGIVVTRAVNALTLGEPLERGGPAASRARTSRAEESRRR